MLVDFTIQLVFIAVFALMVSYFILLVKNKVTKQKDLPLFFALRVYPKSTSSYCLLTIFRAPVVRAINKADVKLAKNALFNTRTMARIKGKIIAKHIVLLVLLCGCIKVSHAVNSIEVQALLGNKVVAQIDGVRRTLSIGKPSPEGVELISLIDNGATLKVNGDVKDYLLGSSVSMNYAEPENLEEKVFSDDRGMFLRNGTINGQSVKFLVDTGATSIAMNTSQAKRLGIRYRLEGKVATVSTASGYVKAYEVNLNTVALGAIKQSNVRAMVIDGKHPGPILLGMTFLSSLKVDTKGNVMTLKKRK